MHFANNPATVATAAVAAAAGLTHISRPLCACVCVCVSLIYLYTQFIGTSKRGQKAQVKEGGRESENEWLPYR